MLHPTNTFKQSLQQGGAPIGLWVSSADAHIAEMLACAGFDWLLIDGEHSPNDLRTTLAQLQAVAPYPSHAVVRPVSLDVPLIKQLLEIGAQTLLVPMIDTAEQAALAVAATRYPPHGIRGVGYSMARSSRWGHIDRYAATASDEICVLVQAETATALKNLDAIVATEGVAGVFFGPADLAASMGFLGNSGAPEVQAAIADGIARVNKAGKAAGILAMNQDMARNYQAMGARFVAVGGDMHLLGQAANQLARAFKKTA